MSFHIMTTELMMEQSLYDFTGQVQKVVYFFEDSNGPEPNILAVSIEYALQVNDKTNQKASC